MKQSFLPSYKQLKEKYPINPKELVYLKKTKKIIKDIFFQKNKKIIIFTGPCSIHDEESTLLYAEKLKNIQKNLKNIFLIMRVFFEKSRTKNDWRGFLYDPDLNNTYNIKKGIIKVRELLINLAKKNVACCYEILDPNISFYFDDLISWSFIGARTSASFLHRQYASLLSMPVGFKNALDGNIDDAINGAITAKSPQKFVSISENGTICQINSDGNPMSHIVLRGSKTCINYDKPSLESVDKKIKKNNLNIPIIIDCSHGNSLNNYLNQIEAFKNILKTINEKKFPIIGIMLESNLIEGKQIFNPLNLRFGLSITDPCLSFEKTQELILLADKHLIELEHCLL